MSVSPIPPGYHSVTPYLTVDGAARALAFYGQVFGARERMRVEAPGGRIGHAEIEIGDSVVMLADLGTEGPCTPPRDDGASIGIHLYVEDADAVYTRAIAAGAVSVQPMETRFYGDRGGTLRDPFGHHWHLATHVEDVPEEEIRSRMQAMASG